MTPSLAALFAAMILAILPQAAAAQERGDPKQGLVTAKETCVLCHEISGERRSPAADAPSFYKLANTPGVNAMALRVALQTSHKRMPNIVLVGKERDDIIAYILSLKVPKPSAS